jgi:hypothetical protein
VFLQKQEDGQRVVFGRVEDSSMPKIAYYMWIKRYNENMPLTSINLCVQIEIHEREREAREGEESLGERERRLGYMSPCE